jgi:hypothetical protein
MFLQNTFGYLYIQIHPYLLYHLLAEIIKVRPMFEVWTSQNIGTCPPFHFSNGPIRVWVGMSATEDWALAADSDSQRHNPWAPRKISALGTLTCSGPIWNLVGQGSRSGILHALCNTHVSFW